MKIASRASAVRIVFFLLTLAAIYVWSEARNETEAEIDYRRASAIIAPTVKVYIASVIRIPIMGDDGIPTGEVRVKIIIGHGTGVVIGKWGNSYVILTARHVTTHPIADIFLIEHPGTDSRIEAQPLCNSGHADAAILITKPTKAVLPVAKIAKQGVYTGGRVWLYGYGKDDGNPIYTNGIVCGESHLGVETTSRINFGCSGGGLWNSEGELVGVGVYLRLRLPWISGAVAYEDMRMLLDEVGITKEGE